jgi:hypothetical protein
VVDAGGDFLIPLRGSSSLDDDFDGDEFEDDDFDDDEGPPALPR